MALTVVLWVRPPSRVLPRADEETTRRTARGKIVGCSQDAGPCRVPEAAQGGGKGVDRLRVSTRRPPRARRERPARRTLPRAGEALIYQL
jgi:hypothetical protein